MKVGITLTPTGAGGAHPHDAVRHLVWAAQYADEHGFDNVWTTEHHFTPVAFSSSPSVLLSHYAAVTKRVNLGYAVAIVPFHHPMRLAEDMAYVDVLSGGRLIAGVSAGWAAYEFGVFGVPHEERRERFNEGFAIIRKALAGGKFSHEGKFWQIKDAQVLPPPIQPGGPKYVMSATSDESVKLCARLRVSPLLGYLPAEGLTRHRALYLEALDAEGIVGAEREDLLSRLGALRRVIIRDTDEEAEREAIDAALGFSRTSATLRTTDSAASSAVYQQPNGAAAPRSNDTTGRPERADHIEGVLRREAPPAPGQDVRTMSSYTGCVWGTPETVARKLADLADLGVGHVIIQFHSTTRDLDGTKTNIRRFATEVLPRYRALLAERRLALAR
ncbi:MAG: LLM class flavin-dependent oxidoreductase [Dehalococcoidia bacterium]|nr:LLM class flavin-dependent oxidoreductase [Dehalococcoidia bacterium]